MRKELRYFTEHVLPVYWIWLPVLLLSRSLWCVHRKGTDYTSAQRNSVSTTCDFVGCHICPESVMVTIYDS